MKTYICIIAFLAIEAISIADAAIIKVGPNRALQLPSHAAAVVQHGDIVEIDAGVYPRDAAVWRADNLTIKGVEGIARLPSGGVSVEGKAIWVIKGSGVTVENIEFMDSSVASHNGAGIRAEGLELKISNCIFRNNENGILAGDNKRGSVTIEQSVFDNNGYGDGYSHNIYIGALRLFILKNSVIRGARIGHQVKSRAAENIIENNLIEDGLNGRSSYLIDLPSGGRALVVGNKLHQGLHAENSTMLAYGAEQMLHQINEVRLIDNIFINENPEGCRAVWIKPQGVKLEVTGNRFVGCMQKNGQNDMKANSHFEQESRNKHFLISLQDVVGEGGNRSLRQDSFDA
jgi:hypothetical protein